MTSPVLLNNVSLLGQSTAQNKRLADLRSLMDNLSRQITTGVTVENYAGLGTNAGPAQNLHAQLPLLKSYQSNIDTVSNKMTLMNGALGNITDVGNQLITALQTNLQSDPTNVTALRQLAQQGLSTVQEMMNQHYNGQYLFAGSDYSAPPFQDANSLNANFANQAAAFLASGDSAALLTAVSGFSDASLGLSAALTDSSSVTTRITDTLNVDYTVKADDASFQDMLRALTLIANLPLPTGGDVATLNDYHDVMTEAMTMLQQGVTGINNTAQTLAGKFSLVQSAQAQNDADINIVQNQISKFESADTAAAITQMQLLQTQLEAAYQVTGLVSKLSLVNFID